jgi:regulator of RNase E activity RraA
MGFMNHDLNAIRSHLYAAVICDALDQIGLHHQSPRVSLPLQTRLPDSAGILAGRCKTTLWADMAHLDPEPYALELKAVDECNPDDVFVAAAGGSIRSGIWGELLTTAAKNRGCVGAIVDGAIRDVAKIATEHFPVFAKSRCVYDSLHRQRVIDVDIPVEIDGVRFEPGDLVVADADGVVVVPKRVEEDVLKLAFAKVLGENQVRDAIREGMSSREAFKTFGIL